jgi:hypothetical protein
MALACRPEPAPLADGSAVAAEGASRWLDTPPPDVVDAVETPDAGRVPPALVAETAPATA